MRSPNNKSIFFLKQVIRDVCHFIKNRSVRSVGETKLLQPNRYSVLSILVPLHFFIVAE
jgi:hypothetical protein